MFFSTFTEWFDETFGVITSKGHAIVFGSTVLWHYAALGKFKNIDKNLTMTSLVETI